jgi:hypothetical protein
VAQAKAEAVARGATRTGAMVSAAESDWYKDAIIYQLHNKA